MLCGGRSSRMGSDKAGLAIDGQSFLERALHVLDAVVTDVRIACGPTPRYLEYGRELVLDRAGDLGPLGGLEAALFSTRAEFVLALACDMPRVDSALLAELVDVAIARDLDVCVLRSTRGIEP
ncbi:MAG: molybdenum cofactor guanylyltransferase, partial [Planctomycetota bacterium]|nr:molybdenum cofactor guanylyltransferase [Planctomycetota bacterium]